MIKKIATTEQVSFVKNFLSDGKVANRGKFDGDYYKQFFGIMAQVIICDELNLPRPENKHAFDGGFDIIWKEQKWDIKCELRNVDFNKNYVHNLSEYQANYPCDGYIFLSYNQESGEFFICGYIYKEELFLHAVHFNAGDKRPRDDGTFMSAKSGFYELPNKYLNELRP